MVQILMLCSYYTIILLKEQIFLKIETTGLQIEQNIVGQPVTGLE